MRLPFEAATERRPWSQACWKLEAVFKRVERVGTAYVARTAAEGSAPTALTTMNHLSDPSPQLAVAPSNEVPARPLGEQTG